MNAYVVPRSCYHDIFRQFIYDRNNENRAQIIINIFHWILFNMGDLNYFKFTTTKSDNLNTEIMNFLGKFNQGDLYLAILPECKFSNTYEYKTRKTQRVT